MKDGRRPNRLIHEKSPYLLQHAYNPVNWYPWGEEAFSRARSEGKPIFLSIGYSTCHWCHVMERESFENDSIAALLNEGFVCIKVDREERSDVDRIYMTAVQAMGQGGGWPMSMFLTPDLKPFYGGTYFPPETRYGRIGFSELLKRIKDTWDTQREKVLDSAEGLSKHLQEVAAAKFVGTSPERSVLDSCFDQIKSTYDPGFGGFGEGPKFPRPSVFNFLLRYFHLTGNRDALLMTERTLQKMAEGGIYDHIGGGFHRYAVDAEWRVPHFEKMLYDQAQLVNAYLDLYLTTKHPLYATVVREVLDYVLRDMTGTEGGFLSAEDADSPVQGTMEEKGEGAFYIWSLREIRETLGEESANVFAYHYGLKEEGNALSDPGHEFTGKNILYVSNGLDAAAGRFGKSVAEMETALRDSRSILLQVRSKRPRPHLDDKVIASWNGLMISAFARAYQVLEEERYLMSAKRAAAFIVNQMRERTSGVLSRRYRDGEARFAGQLEDYAFMTQGLIDLYEASFDLQWLEMAIVLTRKQIEFFWDSNNGGFYDTVDGDVSLLVRTKEQYDGAEPAGNSIGVMNLLRLSEMTDNDEWRERAEATFKAFSLLLQRRPAVMPQMAAALDYSRGKRGQIILVGNRTDPEIKNMLREVRSRFLPGMIVLLLEHHGQGKSLGEYLSFASTLTALDGKATAYVCEDYVCRLPTNESKVLATLLEKSVVEH